MKGYVCRLITLTILGGLSMQTQAADPQSYPLFCKGSKDMKLQIYPGSDSVNVTLHFKHGARAVSQGLNGGECTWSDRGMNQSEPSKMIFKLRDVYLSMTVGPGDSVVMTSQGLTSATNSTAAALEQILRAVRSGQEFQVHAYSRRDALQVTKLGP